MAARGEREGCGQSEQGGAERSHRLINGSTSSCHESSAARGRARLVDPRIRVEELRLAAWDAYVAGRWAGIAGTLPSAEALAWMLEGPFVIHASFFPHE